MLRETQRRKGQKQDHCRRLSLWNPAVANTNTAPEKAGVPSEGLVTSVPTTQHTPAFPQETQGMAEGRRQQSEETKPSSKPDSAMTHMAAIGQSMNVTVAGTLKAVMGKHIRTSG